MPINSVTDPSLDPSVGASNGESFHPRDIADIGAALNKIAAKFELGAVAPEANSGMLVPRVTDTARSKHSGCRDCE
jgi:hypothetical protein